MTRKKAEPDPLGTLGLAPLDVDLTLPGMKDLLTDLKALDLLPLEVEGLDLDPLRDLPEISLESLKVYPELPDVSLGPLPDVSLDPLPEIDLAPLRDPLADPPPQAPSKRPR